MKFIFSFIFLAILFSGCGNSKPDEAEISIKLTFPEKTNCKTYLADHFLVTMYDSNQKKAKSEKFDCTEDTDELIFFAKKDTYYLTVALKGTDQLNKSYGSGRVDLSKGDNEIEINMEEYLGGITFLWSSSVCSRYDIQNFKITLSNENGPVSAVVWGIDSDIEDFTIFCSAEIFEVVNIPAGLYTATINGFRTEESKTPRIIFTQPEFKGISGQDQRVELNINNDNINVSDIIVQWVFDSRSIASCSDAGISKVVTSLISDTDTLNLEVPCDNKFTDFSFYDVTEGKYDIYVRGMNESEETLFEDSEMQKEIKKGSIGSDRIVLKYLIKEKVQ